MGCSIQAVNQYKLGISRPSLENLCKIADFYGVSTDYLLGLTDVPSVDPQIQIAHKVTGLSEDAIHQLSRLATVANGNRAVNALLGNPKLYNFASYLATFFYGGWVEEFTGEEEGHLTSAEITQLLQCAMFVAGIGTCMQLYPVWKIGSKLPVVMGVSFTFLGSLLVICTNPDLGYEGMIGAVILGGIFEGIVGLSAKYWKRFLTPVVSACVVIAIGLSLLSVGMDSWGGGNGAADFGSWYHLLVGT